MESVILFKVTESKENATCSLSHADPLMFAHMEMQGSKSVCRLKQGRNQGRRTRSIEKGGKGHM